jgi:26S proteasome regulatory subunit N4
MSRAHALSLMQKKETLETELQAQYSILSSNQSTMNTPLVDPEGFPRSDIDVWAVRHARVRVIELRNDLNGLIDEIATALIQADKEGDASGGGVAKLTNGSSANGENAPNDLTPFARVDGVAPSSPAAAAVRPSFISSPYSHRLTEMMQDLRREDLILRFGRLTALDFRNTPRSLGPLASLVAEYENVRLFILLSIHWDRFSITLFEHRY